ncbi:putative DNA-binding transcriptional regulator YafY [Kutzneria viridogrisea]|uniref:DNA-binding transcriptional regulator YafY n=1 Tax=Kutzneria viridogrisea TaxID=47990 RepID=A0ABR6BQV9_9PSEU|nr:putative DNA-binding transcriptional regulator YafY [Kutzneria viridogrisea]
MDRTDRLHALVEQLRESTPVPCSARSLAKRYGVSVRTVLRDISMLQQAGVPISASIGRQGGYVLEQARALPPITVTQGEAIAVVVALRALRDERLDGAGPCRAGQGARGDAAHRRGTGVGRGAQSQLVRCPAAR